MSVSAGVSSSWVREEGGRLKTPLTNCESHSLLASRHRLTQCTSSPAAFSHAFTRRGLSIRLTSLGPAYRIACRDEGGAILGVTQGFKVPLFPILHADTMQVQRPRRMGAGSFWAVVELLRW